MNDPKPFLLLTGGNRGIGRAIMKAFCNSHNIVATFRDRESARRASEESGLSFIPVIADFSTKEASARIVKACIDNDIVPDVVILNAGMGVFCNASELTAEVIDTTIRVNLTSQIELICTLLPLLSASGKGHILIVNSVASRTTFTNCSLYSASKAGLSAFIAGLRSEVRHLGIKVTDCLIGATATEIWSPDMLATHSHLMMTADEVAKSLLHIVELAAGSGVHPEEIVIRPQGGDL